MNFLSQIVTGAKTLVAYDTLKTKHQSMEWRHTASPAKVKICDEDISLELWLGRV